MRDEKYNPLTIMVVEDDELGRKYIKALLQGIGVGLIIGAENGADGLNALVTAAFGRRKVCKWANVCSLVTICSSEPAFRSIR